MRKPTLLLAILTTALGLGTGYFYREYQALEQSIAGNGEQCNQQIARLKSEHQAQLDELRKQLLPGQ